MKDNKDRCGNCSHVEIARVTYAGWESQDDFRLECDCYFPGKEWCESSGWLDGVYSVVDFGFTCRWKETRWELVDIPRGL